MPGGGLRAVAVILAGVALSACTSVRIAGLDARAVETALDAEHARPGATRAACPDLAGDYAARGARQATRGPWPVDTADFAALLQWQGWALPSALTDGAPRVRVLDDAEGTPSLQFQALSATGAVMGEAATLGTMAAPPAWRALACLDGRLVLRTRRDWRNGGETLVTEHATVVMQPLPTGLGVSAYRQQITRGGLLFPITTRQRASSLVLFEAVGSSPARSPD